MMPRVIHSGAPPGEKALFRALASAPSTSDWVVLHSLGIADHVRQVEGEADFVVLVPGVGVLVLEVKSHRSVSCGDDGLWRLGSQAPTARGPFQQAKEAMHSIRAFLDREGGTRGTAFVAAVWFTGVRARSSLPRSPEWHDWEILDSEDLQRDPVASIMRALNEGKAHIAMHSRVGAGGQPDEANMQRLVRLLRPRFEVHVVPADVRRARQRQLLGYLDEQFEALDAMADNRAVLFTGPAGAGKTLLATEAVRRESLEGRSGRLICFNRFLGQQLSSDVESLVGVTAGTLHQEMLRISHASTPTDPAQDFWERELPDRAAEALLERPDLAADYLIVDEAQDVVAPQYLDVLDLMVDGGLAAGRVLLFGDFERQALFGSIDGRPALRERCPGLVSHRLCVNCRNVPRIGYLTNSFSGLDPGYTRFRRSDDGIDPDFITFNAGADQTALLLEAVQGLRGEGYDLNEIVVLSPLRTRSTAETTTDAWLRGVLRPVDGGPPRAGKLQYTTIHSFKGLESPAVVLTDLDQDGLPGFRSILYVGLTRATDRLVALIEARTLRAALGGFK
jgi:hypothetical protein